MGIAPPAVVRDAATWGSFFKNVLLPIVGSGLAVWLGIDVSWVLGILFLIAVTVYFSLTFFTRKMSSTTREAIDILRERKIPSGEERWRVSEHLARLERRYRYAVLFATFVLTSFVLVVLGYYAYDWLTKKVPTDMSLESVERFSPVFHKAWIIKAPFIEAMVGSLEEEGKAAKQKCQIYVIKTSPTSHSTFPFLLQLGFEGLAYDITGYAFRKRSDSQGDEYESVPIEFPTSNEIHLNVPACKCRDRLVILARISLNRAEEFPTRMEERIKVVVKPAKEKK